MLERPEAIAYPGRPGPVCIRDGAGIVPIILPLYCPFWNPIESFFALLKRKLCRSYADGKLKPKELERFVNDVMFDFIGQGFPNLFAHGGDEGMRLFHPSRNFDAAMSIVAV